MAKALDRIDRSVLALVTVIPGYAVGAGALLAYAAGLVIPLGLHLSAMYVLGYNLLGASVAVVLGVGWLIAQKESADRRHLFEWTTNLRLLTAEEFEWLAGELFRREGWQVREVGHQGSPDGNIDLRLTRRDQRAIVQCKRWTARAVGVDEIRRFAGTLYGEQPSGVSGIFVTLSDFTDAAIVEAQKKRITLINRQDLHSRVEAVRRAEPCPNCAAPMILDRSARGWWLRCVNGACQGKRDLGAEPGRAVELLTQPPQMPR